MATITSAGSAPPDVSKLVDATQAPKETNQDIEKVQSKRPSAHDVEDQKPDKESEYKLEGVKQIEAITSIWTSKMLWATFILLYVVTFVDMLITSVQSNLNPYVTSAFGRHGLLGTPSIVSTILGGVLKLSIAKIIDIWGRLEGFLATLLLITVGLIMKSLCQNVETYAAAHTMFWVGHLGYMLVIDVVLSDMTTLKNRMIMLGINTTPTIATTFAGPKIAELFYTKSHFRWAFGSLGIILLGFSVPVAAIFMFNQRKAKKLGEFPEKAINRTWFASVKHYTIEFDVVGMFLITVGFALLLLPFSLNTLFTDRWATDGIIAMTVIGVVSLGVFVIWERYFAPISFFPFKFVRDRSVLGACLCNGLMFASIFCWDTYYGSYLQVVHSQSIVNSGYILNSFSLGASFIAPFVGLLIRYTGQYKWPAIIGGIPLCVLGTALLIHFRTQDAEVGYLVMCQLLNGFASGFFVACAYIAIMAAVSHQEIAVGLALFGLFASIGAAIGQAVAAALWTNILPMKLREFLPEGSKNLTATIYGSLRFSYRILLRKMVIGGSVIIPFLLLSILMWRNINVKTHEAINGTQAKGNLW